MATIGDPADGQFQAAKQSKLDELVQRFTTGSWRYASNMKSGEPTLLADEIVRLRALLQHHGVQP